MNIPYRFKARGDIGIKQFIKRKSIYAYSNMPNYFIKPIKSDKSFLFICGCGHSGTSLLASRLGQHPDALLIGRETHCFDPVKGFLLTSALLKEWEFFADYEKKKLIIEKTPKHIQSINRINNLVPHGKFICIVRNPLDTIASLYKRFGDLNLAINRWIIDNKKVIKYRKNENLIVIYYENLTKNPELSFRSALQFLSMQYSNKVMESGRSGYKNLLEKGGNMAIRAEQTARDIYPNDGKWRKVLSKDEACLVVSKTKVIAEKLGYRNIYL